MDTSPRFGIVDALQLAFVLAVAAALRIGYLHVATDDGRAEPALVVQGEGVRPDLPRDVELRGRKSPSEFDSLVHNLAEHRWFGMLAPLAEREEPTAHAAPGYFWLVAQIAALASPPDALIRWLQCGFGILTVGCLFFFTRRAFAHPVVALIAGLLGAVHPFWIVSIGELNDGALATFLLAAALMLGTRGRQAGGAFTSLSFGLCLAGLAMVRAAMLPFALVSLLWFLYQCKHVRYGWFNAVLVLLGFANGLAPWAVRNWRVHDEAMPIVTSAYLHLWIGNNPNATGGPMDEAALRKTLPEERVAQLLDEPNQAKRYARLGQDVLHEIRSNPGATATRRLQAGWRFLTGAQWCADQRISRDGRDQSHRNPETPPEWLAADLELWLQGSLLTLLVLGLLGWRWSFAWKKQTRLATLALLWIPLPYVLSHAEALSGPRLPWDAVLICFSAYALASAFPTVAGSAEAE